LRDRHLAKYGTKKNLAATETATWKKAKSHNFWKQNQIKE
jgi:hypothetical protein